jgi:hypothetical protein
MGETRRLSATRMPRPGFLLVIVFAALAQPGVDAAAAPATGATVQGVVIPPPRVIPPPTEHLGFLEPIENPIAGLRQIDPLPEIFIYLEPEGGAAPPEEWTKPLPGSVAWNLGSSFAAPVLPVVIGSAVKIVNNSRETHLLYSPDAPELIRRDPLGPATSRDIALGTQATPVRVRSRSVPHVTGSIVPLPSRLFTRVERNGRFRLDSVPSGRWVAKVWFRNGWLTVAKLSPFEVGAKTVDLKIELPDPLVPAGK